MMTFMDIAIVELNTRGDHHQDYGVTTLMLVWREETNNYHK